jgi:chromosomal replication initiation ATPase DnaA
LASIYRFIIEHAVAEVFSVPINDLRSQSRGFAHIARARQAAMYLAHVVFRCDMTAVARACGRDRTTVKHACAVIEDMRDDPVFNRTMDLLEAIICQLCLLSGMLAARAAAPFQFWGVEGRVTHVAA